MKNTIIVLGIVCAALIGGFWFQNNQANKDLKAALADTARFSNQCEQINLKLTDQTSVNNTLMTNLTRRTEELAAASNQIAKLGITLAQAEKARQAAGVEIAERDTRISDWETRHGELAMKANELKSSLGKLELEIADVRKKLDASEGDRAFLLTELRGLQSEKAHLDRQFHNLAAVRAQFEKLKKDQVINERLAWADTTFIRPDRKVELQQDGSVRLLPAAKAR